MFGHDDTNITDTVNSSDPAATSDNGATDAVSALDAANNDSTGSLGGTVTPSSSTPLNDQPDSPSTPDLTGSTNQVPDNAPYNPDDTSADDADKDDKDLPANNTNSPSDEDKDGDDDRLKAVSNDDQPANEELLNLKKQSLEQLIPLVGHLDQTAEEKYRTTMMMIQATDDSSLIKDAYSAAQKISDDKVRAQALLDIVNEINYFTQVASSDKDDSASDDINS